MGANALNSTLLDHYFHYHRRQIDSEGMSGNIFKRFNRYLGTRIFHCVVVVLE